MVVYTIKRKKLGWGGCASRFSCFLDFMHGPHIVVDAQLCKTEQEQAVVKGFTILAVLNIVW